MSNCGAEIRSKHRNCPQVGDSGICLLVYLTILKYHLRDKKSERFPVLITLHLKAVLRSMDGLLRIGNSCKGGHDDLIITLSITPMHILPRSPNPSLPYQMLCYIISCFHICCYFYQRYSKQ